MQGSLEKREVNGVELHYVDRGEGTPVILVHGGLQDYRYWADYVDDLRRDYRVVAYSRRYNHPNDNPQLQPDYSPLVDAEDLAALAEELDLEAAHIAAHSYGAFAALAFALRRPGAVRSLALGEPPAHRLALETEEGRLAFQDLMQSAWMPAVAEFRMGNTEEALRKVAEYFLGGRTLEDLSDRGREVLRANSRELEAQATSLDSFPELDSAKLRSLDVSVLLLTGDDTVPVHRIVDDRLGALLPRVERRRVPGAGHSVWRDAPEVCLEAARKHFARH